LSRDLGSAQGSIQISTQQLDEAKTQVDGILGSLGNAFTNFGLIATGAVAGVTAGIAGIAVSGSQAAIDLDQQMADIASVMSSTREEVAPLNDLIFELGLNPNLKVEVDQAAGAIEVLARNGANLDEIQSGLAESSIFLANATGGDFAEAADLATDLMKIFGLEADNVNVAVDGATSVINNSKFSFNDYALAVARGAGASEAMGLSLDDFNVAIAGTSSLFNSGAEAGTGLRVMLERFIPKSDAASDTMKELGLIAFDTEEAMRILKEAGVEPLSDESGDLQSQLMDLWTSMGLLDSTSPDLGKEFDNLIESTGLMQNQFFNADGSMKDMADIAGILQTSFADLSDEQRNTALKTIFSGDAMRSVVGIMELGEDGFNSLADTMSQTDAFDSASTRMDSVGGAIEIMMGIVDAAKIQIGQAFLPAIKSVAEALSTFFADNQDIIVGFFGQLAQFVQDLVTILLDASSPVEAFRSALALLVPEETVNSIVTVVSGIVSFVTTIVGFVSEHASTILAVFEALAVAFVAFNVISTVVGFISSLVTVFGTLTAAVSGGATVIGTIVAIMGGPLTVAIAAISLALGVLTTAWLNNWGDIQGKVEVVRDFLSEVSDQIVAYFVDVILPALTNLWDQWVNVIWPAIGEIVRSIWDSIIVPIFDAYVAYISNVFIPTILFLWDQWVNVIWPAIGDAVRFIWDSIVSPILTAYVTYITDFFIPTIQELWDQWVNVIWPAISEAIETVWNDVIQPILLDFDAFLNDELLPTIQELWDQWVNVIWPAISEAIQLAWDNIIKPILDNLVEDLIVALPNALAEIQIKFSNAIGAIQTVIETVKGIWDTFVDAVKGFADWLSTNVFNFEINLPSLPDWAIPGSPLPIHLAWQAFDRDILSKDLSLNLLIGGALDLDRPSSLVQNFFQQTPNIGLPSGGITIYGDIVLPDVSDAESFGVSLFDYFGSYGNT
jgi:hypothetical protein